MAVSDMKRNGYLKRPNLENNEVSVKLDPAVRKSNNSKQTRFKEKKRERDKLVMQEGNKNDRPNDQLADLPTDV